MYKYFIDGSYEKISNPSSPYSDIKPTLNMEKPKSIETFDNTPPLTIDQLNKNVINAQNTGKSIQQDINNLQTQFKKVKAIELADISNINKLSSQLPQYYNNEYKAASQINQIPNDLMTFYNTASNEQQIYTDIQGQLSDTRVNASNQYQEYQQALLPLSGYNKQTGVISDLKSKLTAQLKIQSNKDVLSSQKQNIFNKANNDYITAQTNNTSQQNVTIQGQNNVSQAQNNFIQTNNFASSLKAQLDIANKNVTTKQTELSNAQKTLSNAQTAYNNAQKTLTSAQTAYNKAQTDLTNAQKENSSNQQVVNTINDNLALLPDNLTMQTNGLLYNQAASNANKQWLNAKTIMSSVQNGVTLEKNKVDAVNKTVNTQISSANKVLNNAYINASANLVNINNGEMNLSSNQNDKDQQVALETILQDALNSKAVDLGAASLAIKTAQGALTTAQAAKASLDAQIAKEKKDAIPICSPIENKWKTISNSRELKPLYDFQSEINNRMNMSDNNSVSIKCLQNILDQVKHGIICIQQPNNRDC
jgi:hypothetical protein